MYLFNLSDICIFVCGLRKIFFEVKYFGVCKIEYLKYFRLDYLYGFILLLFGLYFGFLCILLL